MKKITTILLMLALGTTAIKASVVTKEKALTVATNFYQRKMSPSVTTFKLVYTETAANGDPVYYAFNAGKNNGFIIVSAEDAGHAIIGYSDKGCFAAPKTENNLSYWMAARKTEILKMRTGPGKANSAIADEWADYINNPVSGTHSFKSAINTYMCQTTWSQAYPYNTSCPSYQGLYPCYTGCVATAMAQIMKYWSFPAYGTGYNSYTYSYNPFGDLTMFFSSPIAWSSMPNSPTSNNVSLADLMEELGYSVDMNYSWTPAGSAAFVTETQDAGASAQNSYSQYFYYNPVTAVLQTSYTSSAWVTLIENELIASRPVQYYGYESTGGGHTWVCDGYNSSNDFHMNWGWSDTADGWYLPTNLDPEGALFNTNIGALIGIEPSNQPFINYTNSQEPAYCYSASSHTVAFTASDYYDPKVTYTWTVTGTGTSITTSGTNNNSAVVTYSSTTQGNVTVQVTASAPTGTTGFTTKTASSTFWVGAPISPTAGLVYVQMGKSCYYNASIGGSTGATSYEWSHYSNFSSIVETTTTPVTTNLMLDPLTTYTFYVRGVNACGNGPSSVAQIRETPAKPAGGCLEAPRPETESGMIDFKFFPVPASSELNIQYTIATGTTNDVTIELYDMLGKKVANWTLSANDNIVTENVSGLAKGMYIYSVNSGNSILQRGKIMIQR